MGEILIRKEFVVYSQKDLGVASDDNYIPKKTSDLQYRDDDKAYDSNGVPYTFHESALPGELQMKPRRNSRNYRGVNKEAEYTNRFMANKSQVNGEAYVATLTDMGENEISRVQKLCDEDVRQAVVKLQSLWRKYSTSKVDRLTEVGNEDVSVVKSTMNELLVEVNNDIIDKKYGSQVCSICFDTFGAEEATSRLRPCCGTSTTFDVCKSCLSRHAFTNANENMAWVICPNVECRETYADQTVVQLLSLGGYTDAIAKYKAALEEVTKARQQSSMNILGHIKDHVSFRTWAAGNTRRCPNCKVRIQKNGGCQHMTCRRCGYEFHWCCGQKYRNSYHSSLVCVPIKLYYDDHPAWGPVTPVRALTKLTVGTAGCTVVTAAAVGVATAAGVAGLFCFVPLQVKRKIDQRTSRNRAIQLEAKMAAEWDEYVKSRDDALPISLNSSSLDLVLLDHNVTIADDG